MSFGSSFATVNSATAHANYQKRSHLQGSGPWANLSASFWAQPPTVLTGGLDHSFLFGHSPETGYICYRGNHQAYQLFKMVPLLTSGLEDTNVTNVSSNGNHGNGGCSTSRQLALTQNASEDSPLDFSSSGPFGKEVAADVVTQEVRGSPDAMTREAPAPPTSSEDVHVQPMDLSSQKGDSICSEKPAGVRDDSNGDPKSVEDLKAEIGELQVKLERSRDDLNRRALQMANYSMMETTALLKAIYWKGQLHIDYDDLPIKHLPVKMKSMLFWDEDFRGQGSLLTKFRENLTGKRDRDSESIKSKWNRIFKWIAKKPHEFFQKNCSIHKMEDEEKQFLIKLAQECCVLKGIDISNQRPETTAPPRPPRVSVPPPPPSSVGNTFMDDDDDFLHGWRDMPVFSASQWPRSGTN